MKNKSVMLLMLLIIVLIMCVGCSAKISMPYSSDEYENGEWTVEEVVKHFKELGFEEVEIAGNTSRIESVIAENDDSKYESFDKGQKISTSRKIGIYTFFELAPPLAIDNCPELAEFVKIGIESDADRKEWATFLESHDGELLVFEGTITDWYDDLFWTGVSFSVAVEDSKYMSFSKSSVDLLDLGMTGEYHYNNYHAGLIEEGMRVYVVTEITQVDGEWDLELCSMQIIQ